MKILIASSKHFYNKIEEIKSHLENKGHIIALPNSYNEPFKEDEMKNMSREKHIEWKSAMLKKHSKNIMPNDAILVLNFNKNQELNYIGGATFLEIAKAWELNKIIFLYNPIPNNLFKDELTAINPIVLEGNLDLIK